MRAQIATAEGLTMRADCLRVGNLASLGRRHHRAKTHLGYRVHQLRPNAYLWRTPHGLWRLDDGSGTHRVQAG